MSLATYYANNALDSIVSTAGTMTVALSITEPAINDTVSSGISNVTEPTGGSYARASLPTSAWAAAANRAKVTNTDITFNTPTGAWGSVQYVVVYAGTRCVFAGELAYPVDVVAGGDQIRIPAGTLSLALPI